MEFGEAFPLLKKEWPDLAACRADQGLVRRLRGMLDGYEVELAARTRELTSCPEAMFAEVNQTGLGAAGRILERSDVCESMPELGEVLAAGDTTGAHVDVVAGVLRSLTAEQRDKLAAHGERLARDASRLPKREFEQRVKALAGAVTSDDGVDRLARQKRARRLSLREGFDGMWVLRGEFDPESAAILQARLTRQVEAMFHGDPPQDAPIDPLERQGYLRAVALLALVDGKGAGSFGPDLTVLIDAKTLLEGEHEDSIVEIGDAEFQLPVDTIRRWACMADVTPMIVGEDGTRLYVGRTIRVANREQRRALRVHYRTCGFCPTPFSHCEIHHIKWFRHGGSTNIDNLIPVCALHHHLLHEGGARLEVHDDGSITLILPDGTRQNHDPPTIRAA